VSWFLTCANGAVQPLVEKDPERQLASLLLGMVNRHAPHPRKSHRLSLSAHSYPTPTQSIAGAIGLAWYLSHNAPSHQQPTAIGGSADELASSSSSVILTSTRSLGVGGQPVQTSPHVSPTNTVARRAETTVVVEGRDVLGGGIGEHKRRRGH
jgi:hypothetical protein